MTLQTQIGEKLKHFRLTKKLSQQEVANATNIDQKYISKIESGKMNITLSTLERIATELDKKVNVKFTGK